MNPPNIVINSVEASCFWNICIPANVTTAKVLDSKKDMLLDTADEKKRERMEWFTNK